VLMRFAPRLGEFALLTCRRLVPQISQTRLAE
jgi:hypothetical protein